MSSVQEQTATVQPVTRKEATTEISRDNMEVCTDLILRDLYIDPMEKFMDENAGTVTELRGL